MALRVFNYLTRTPERFRPLERDYVSMYVCGPKVHDHAHLGHAKTYVAMDVIVRYLQHTGYRVRHVRNLTDLGYVPGYLPSRATPAHDRESKESVEIAAMEIADTFIQSFHDDLDALNVLRPNISPRATGHIAEIIQWVQNLIDRGFAYQSHGNVFFSSQQSPTFGHLAQRSIGDLIPEADESIGNAKRHPTDFVLWRRADPQQGMHWPSPWGEGLPGWHIECSVTATKYLGPTFDIHGGSEEDIFPHHECEIAQSEAYHGTPLARYWILVGALRVNGVRMSRRRGNFLTIKDALRLYSPEAIRCFILSNPYREPVEFSREAMKAAQNAIDGLHHTVRQLRHRIQQGLPQAGMSTAALSGADFVEEHRQRFKRAMDDDFDTAQALVALFDLGTRTDHLLQGHGEINLATLSAIDRAFRELGGSVLGIVPDNVGQRTDATLLKGMMEILLDLQKEYRQAEEWERAEAIRARLEHLGIDLDDADNEPS